MANIAYDHLFLPYGEIRRFATVQFTVLSLVSDNDDALQSCNTTASMRILRRCLISKVFMLTYSFRF